MVVFGECAQVEAVELLNDGSGLAFGIVGGRSSGVVVKTILPGGVADRDGRLRSGDRLLRIGCVSVVGMCARQAAAVLRQCGACVRLLVARPADAAPQSLGASPAPIVPSRLLADPLELERYLAARGCEGFGDTDDDITDAVPEPTLIEERHLMRPVASIVAVVPRGALRAPPPALPAPPLITTTAAPAPLRLPLDMAVRGEPETLSYSAELSKDASLGLGITVAGYVCEQEELSGIFVKSISKSSSAYLSGKIRVNDRIVEVDGVSLNGVSNHKAVALLRDARGSTVRLRMLRYLRGARYERLQKALSAQGGRRSPAPPSPSATSLANYSFSVYDESTAIETELDSEAPHPPSPASPSDELEIVLGADDAGVEREEARAIQDKWREILAGEPDWPGHGDPYDIIVGTIMKEKDTGLGISLCGTVRVVGGREVQARHYIRAVAPHGPLAAAALHRVGDELLEVNGWRVLGVHHVEVVSRLRGVAAPVRLVCARRRGAGARVIDTARHCGAFHARSILGGSLQNLLMPPQRLIKAKSESSVASLCSANTVLSTGQDEFCPDLERNKSRSLEPLSGLAMWSDQPEYIQLQKEDRGLGFSILDYLDPSEPGRSVIVVRSVVSGGAAAADGRLAPGDRLLSVNGEDVARAPLAAAVRAIKSAPRGTVTIGVAKPLPCSSIVGGDKVNGNSLSSQECINSMGSDEHTGFDSFHECLQEYQEGLEVVQICLEPEDPSIKDEEVSAFEDLSMDECRNGTDSPKKIVGDKNSNILKEVSKILTAQVNGEFISINGNIKSSKSDESLDDHDDDMTITEDDPEETPRDLPEKQHYIDIRSKSADRKSMNFKEDRAQLSQQQSKDISTSDEMVFAVTPTGLERISFERYWKQDEITKGDEKTNADKIKSDESWKDCLNSPNSETPSFCDATAKLSVQDSNSLLYIDHECDGYETCLDDDSNSVKAIDKSKELKSINETDNIVTTSSKQDKVASAEQLKSDDEISAKSISKDTNVSDDATSYENYPYVQEHIIKQMKSLHIEPLNVNITHKKFKKRSPNKTKVPKTCHRKCVEYYNDQAECLEEYNRLKKLEEEQILHKEEQKKLLQSNRITLAKNLLLKKQQEPSEESTDQETGYVPGCHKCFLENYAYAITKAYIAKANACKFCEVIREMLEPPKRIPDRSVSAPAMLDWDGGFASETDEECHLMVPVSKDRRKSAGPLRFLVPSRRQSYAPPPNMTVSVSREPSKESDVAQRWGSPRKVALKRKVADGSLGISIVGGKVDIVSNRASDGEDKGIFGIFIKNVVADSPAGHTGELHTGDRILEVDGACVRSAPHERAVQLIKAAGQEVVLTVQSLQAWTTDSSDVEPDRGPSTTSPTPSAVSSTASVKRRAPPPPKGPVASASKPPKSPSSPIPSQARSPVSPSSGPSKSPVSSPAQPQSRVTSPQPPKSPVTPTAQPLKSPAVSIAPTSPQPAHTTPEHEIKITVTADPESAQEEDDSKKEVTFDPVTDDKPTYSDEESSDEDEDDRRDLEGRTYSEKGFEIDRASAGAIRRSKEEREADKEEEDEFGYTANKIRKKYSPLGDTVVCVRLERSGTWGLGLSLAGHRDRSRMAVFVCGLHPAGGAARAQPAVRVGDEILEVNGIVLHGRCHLNASAIIKALPGPVFRVILLRRKQAIDDVAVKPLTQFPVALEEESEDKFAGYKGVRHVTIRKGTASLGIMIIEGRHAEVGQGIFISDIQEGSAAELAGLQIGDLILAVNKDSLLGSSYDAAASMLKRTEGVVVLTVCNPNKNDDSPAEETATGKPGSRPTSRNEAADAGGLKPAAGASRPQTPAKPQPSPAKAEPPPDPATAPIVPGKNTVIDLNTQSQSPGILLVGGSDTQVTGGAVVLDVYPGGVAGKDGRLQPGDQIVDSHGVAITKEMTHERLCLTIKQKQTKIRMTVFRPDPIQYQDVEVELARKPGKGLGICVMNRSPPPGSYISDILAGTPADLDGKLQKYDIISSVDGKDLFSANHEDIAVALKAAGPKAVIKVKRFKIVR